MIQKNKIHNCKNYDKWTYNVEQHIPGINMNMKKGCIVHNN